MTIFEYWAVEECYDRDCKVIGNFSNELVADMVAGGKNKMYRSVTKRTFTLFDSVEDFENNTRDKIRARAIAKLTIEEREVLGVK